MRIVSTTIHDLQCAIGEPFGWSRAWTLQPVGIDTDAGIRGWGECSAPVARDLIRIHLCPLPLGADPLARLTLWRRLFHAPCNGGFQVGMGDGAISAPDIALWNVAGKRLDQPVGMLLGGTLRVRIPVHATGLYHRRDESPTPPNEARRYVDAGFMGMKTKVDGLPREADMARVTALRDAVGADIHPMADANRAFVQEPFMKFDRTPNSLREELAQEPFIQQDGYVTVPDGPGLGITLVDSVLERYRVRRQVSDGDYNPGPGLPPLAYPPQTPARLGTRVRCPARR